LEISSFYMYHYLRSTIIRRSTTNRENTVYIYRIPSISSAFSNNDASRIKVTFEKIFINNSASRIIVTPPEKKFPRIMICHFRGNLVEFAILSLRHVKRNLQSETFGTGPTPFY
jgi:hypothetical protein